MKKIVKISGLTHVKPINRKYLTKKKIASLEREIEKEYIKLGKKVCEITYESSQKVNELVDLIVQKKKELKNLEK